MKWLAMILPSIVHDIFLKIGKQWYDTLLWLLKLNSCNKYIWLGKIKQQQVILQFSFHCLNNYDKQMQ